MNGFLWSNQDGAFFAILLFKSLVSLIQLGESAITHFKSTHVARLYSLYSKVHKRFAGLLSEFLENIYFDGRGKNPSLIGPSKAAVLTIL